VLYTVFDLSLKNNPPKHTITAANAAAAVFGAEKTGEKKRSEPETYIRKIFIEFCRGFTALKDSRLKGSFSKKRRRHNIKIKMKNILNESAAQATAIKIESGTINDDQGFELMPSKSDI
jgi:hypothetical protein